MQPPHQRHHSRVNLVELKAQMVKKLGPEESKQYFYNLNRFLSLKLTKVEFSKLCLRIVGRENISLHNQLIRAILRNACTAKVTPPASCTENVDGYRQNGSHPGVSQAYGLPGLSNGSDVLHPSPRKARTGVRDRRTGDRQSALGPNEKSCFVTQSGFGVPLENGDLYSPNMGRSARQQTENRSEIMVRRSPDGLVPSCSKDQAELAVTDDGQLTSARSPLRAPLGVQFYAASVTRVQRTKPPGTSRRFTNTPDNVLLDSLTLRERMEQISVAQGVEGVSMDSANILNRGLDSYMKGLIRSCIELAGARSGRNLITNNTNKHPNCTKLINGVRVGHQYQMPNNGRSLEVQQPKAQCPISFEDFRAAMELNPQKLGVDRPLLLEKIRTRAFDE